MNDQQQTNPNVESGEEATAQYSPTLSLLLLKVAEELKKTHSKTLGLWATEALETLALRLPLKGYEDVLLVGNEVRETLFTPDNILKPGYLCVVQTMSEDSLMRNDPKALAEVLVRIAAIGWYCSFAVNRTADQIYGPPTDRKAD